MDAFLVREMSARDIGPVSDLLAEVFSDNAAYREIFDPRHKSAGLRWLFERNLKLNQRYGTVRVIHPANSPMEIVGTYSLLPPSAKAPTLIDYFRLGIPAMPFRFGLSSLVRMISLMKENQLKIDEAMSGAAYWYLGTVAVSQAYRNRGIASDTLARAFADLPGPKKIALSTQLESNVRLYSRLGFEVIAKNHMGYREKTIHNWVMRLKG